MLEVERDQWGFMTTSAQAECSFEYLKREISDQSAVYAGLPPGREADIVWAYIEQLLKARSYKLV